nr:retrotransposon protein, putative, Ty1-copia subclass [Tanacetum cinerariifolium]
MFLVYEGDLKQKLRVSCYTDAGYLTDVDDLKSQTEYVFVLNGGVVDWKSVKQSIFATSSAKAEYIAASDASKEAVWVRKFIFGLGVVPTIEEPIRMYCDNTGAISIANESGITKVWEYCYIRQIKWLFKKKTDMDGNVHIYKARLVTKGYTQTPWIDYEETFSRVADIRAIRILIAIVAYYDYEIWQMDVKTAFLNGYLNEEVYMEQPEGFVNLKYPNRVCKLKRSIYGLKQASRQWNKRFYDEIKKFGFTQNCDEPCVYIKASGSNITFLILYVNDILIMGNSIPTLQIVKTYLEKCFSMKDLGEAAYILGIKIYRDRSKRLIGLCQSAYIEKILKRYCMENFKRGSIPMQEKLKLSKLQGASTPAEMNRMQNVPYASAIGSIIYAVRCTRPNVANTKDMFLAYEGDLKQKLRVSCYTDAGYLTDADDLKSQTEYVFVLNGGVVDWKSAKQSIFATSYAKAEYIAVSDAFKEAVWVRKFIFGLGVVLTIEEPISMYCDNTGAIFIANESGITKGARHFCAKVHYL